VDFPAQYGGILGHTERRPGPFSGMPAQACGHPVLNCGSVVLDSGDAVQECGHPAQLNEQALQNCG
jgi:hypothetical protein